ncbi:MAG: right-handed parallel beta-helix repeat-containing protein [Actinomycetota bacterium]|nr:right-handed parallel beta-helix repeat-containing protein [Actinomycetota bacterium]
MEARGSYSGQPVIRPGWLLTLFLVGAATTILTIAATEAEAAAIECSGVSATFVGTHRPDTISGRPDRDVVQAHARSDKVRANREADLVCGGRGIDRLNGNRGNDRVMGQNGDDTLFGGPGDDVLVGGGGVDEALGGLGTDVCFSEKMVSCEIRGEVVDSYRQAVKSTAEALWFQPGTYVGDLIQPARARWYAAPDVRIEGELTSGQGGRLDGFEVAGAVVGVRCRAGSTCRDLDVHHHSQSGIQVGGGWVDLFYNYVHDNNLDLEPVHGDNPCWNSGGVHMVVGNHVSVTGNRLINNGCDGVHADTGARFDKFKDNLITGNSRYGIFIEISCDIIIRDNRIQDNALAGVAVYNSPRVAVYDNVFGGNGGPGVRWWDRADRPYGPGAADCQPKDSTGGYASGNIRNGDGIVNEPAPV